MTFQPFKVNRHFGIQLYLFEALIWMYRKGLALSYTSKFRAGASGLFYWFMQFFEHLFKCCTSLIKADMTTCGETLIVVFELRH